MFGAIEIVNRSFSYMKSVGIDYRPVSKFNIVCAIRLVV
jgi:hypothetical protein